MKIRLHHLSALAAISTVGAAALLSGDASAKKEDEESACDKIRPEQRLSEEKQQELQSALDGAIAGLGRAAAEVDTSSNSQVNIQVLSEDALAKSWFVYQTCVMKEAGILDETTAQDLVRQLMGLQPTQVQVQISDPGAGARTTHSGESYIEVWSPNSDAMVYLDGEAAGEVGSGLKLPVPTGSHTVELRHRKYKTVARTVNIAAGSTEKVEVSTMEKKSKLWLWVLLGAAAVAAVVGVVVVSAGGGDYSDGDGGGDYSDGGGDYGGYGDGGGYGYYR